MIRMQSMRVIDYGAEEADDMYNHVNIIGLNDDESTGPTNSDGDDGDSESHSSATTSSKGNSSRNDSSTTTSGTGFGGSSTGKSNTSSRDNIANQHFEEENKRVRFAKCLVGVAFIACAVAMIVAVYMIAKSSDQKSFEIEYEGYIKDILALVIWEVRYNFALMEQLSASITIGAHLLNSTWPYHMEPEVEITAGFVDGMGGIMSAGYAPLISGNSPLETMELRQEWEEYSVKEQTWIETSAYLKAVHPVHRDALHGTIQDHEHDRRLLSQVQQMDTLQNLYSPRAQAIQKHTTSTGARTLQGGPATTIAESISDQIFHWSNGTKITEPPRDEYAPLWQISPATYSSINANLLADERISKLYDVMIPADRAVLSQGFPIEDMFDFLFDPEEKPQKALPHAFILVPIYDDFVDHTTEEPNMVGILIGVTVYTNLFDRLLPQGKDGIIAVLEDTCGQLMSFELNSGKAEFLGYEDVHETEFDDYERFHENLEMYTEEDIRKVEDAGLELCRHDLRIYPSSKFRAEYETNDAAIYAGVVGLAFLGTAMLMLLYDFLVNRRQSKTVQIASRTQAIVTSLFPKDIGRKLVAEAVTDSDRHSPNGTSGSGGPNRGFKNKSRGGKYRGNGGTGKLADEALKDGGLDDEEYDDFKSDTALTSSKPMADLFPEATVFFGDIVGFTAWASTREPTQVFMLLEGLYSKFDKIALKRKVMKIETVGDCYVAVCGLPDPRKDHATVMVRFARDCLEQMHLVLNNLTVTLGPDTTELGIRIGLNSGPVTAGVLRGDRARFQLFGDTVNTCARVEGTGAKNRIHVSEATALLLKAAGKDSWLIQRGQKVNAKGKGEMQTYWVHSTSHAKSVASHTSSNGASATSGESFEIDPMTAYMKSRETNKRVIDWIVELLSALLKEVVARRQTIGVVADDYDRIKASEQRIYRSTKCPLEEVKEVVNIPKFKEGKNTVEPSSIKLPPEVIIQLREYVKSIDKLYNGNHFHSFEHATHVTMSVVKLLKRIVAPTDTEIGDSQNLHDHTYGITSDPLTQFSVVLAALIHDVDHQGVSNTQLLKEGTQSAEMYKGKSIAEQNSVDIAWSMLMEDQFTDLRQVIYTTQGELYRFRQMVVHTVMATDIMDKEINAARKQRWYATFPDQAPAGREQAPPVASITLGGRESDEVDRKATIVIEHLMQASDVAHTMQHWHVYSKWNGRLFKEMHAAYKAGRMGKNPADFWYDGEIGFLDNYVIPLALKLQRCGVFGVFGDEYLNYARENRKEWVEKGKDVIQNLLSEIAIMETDKTIRRGSTQASPSF